MSLLIDGYNLLHASGILPSGRGPNTLERAREALLRFLAASLSAEERARTTIVFDAREAPFNLPRIVEHDGMTVRFAPRDIDADTLIEELIRKDTSPRRLTVVSSDHRIQNAARRRRAEAIDSDIWHTALVQRRQEEGGAPAPAVKPEGPMTTAEVERWVKEFQIDLTEETLPEEPGDIVRQPKAEGSAVEQSQTPPQRSDRRRRRNRRGADKASDKLPGHMPNPFPPGYGEDIAEEDVG